MENLTTALYVVENDYNVTHLDVDKNVTLDYLNNYKKSKNINYFWFTSDNENSPHLSIILKIANLEVDHLPELRKKNYNPENTALPNNVMFLKFVLHPKRINGSILNKENTILVFVFGNLIITFGVPMVKLKLNAAMLEAIKRKKFSSKQFLQSINTVVQNRSLVNIWIWWRKVNEVRKIAEEKINLENIAIDNLKYDRFTGSLMKFVNIFREPRAPLNNDHDPDCSKISEAPGKYEDEAMVFATHFSAVSNNLMQYCKQSVFERQLVTTFQQVQNVNAKITETLRELRMVQAKGHRSSNFIHFFLSKLIETANALVSELVANELSTTRCILLVTIFTIFFIFKCIHFLKTS
ncbi:hypothetical protein, no similarity [Maudiozyma saulgeensis]|uniref:Uncharacterized protein n=1 Tax=Maudiozyma saulgeensis TaxID=1789683 RepID=A0A1X7R6T9_9SACH|nr:hypothetical protein, no similarity [Kazachstania saulgeensis]